MKHLVLAGTGAFVAGVLALAAAGLLAGRGHERTSPPPEGDLPRISSVELARHATPDDCWIAVRGGVYDVTGYIDAHPAPRATIVSVCGTDATEAFATKGKGTPHSPSAHALLETMKVGTYTL